VKGKLWNLIFGGQVIQVAFLLRPTDYGDLTGLFGKLGPRDIFAGVQRRGTNEGGLTGRKLIEKLADRRTEFGVQPDFPLKIELPVSDRKRSLRA